MTTHNCSQCLDTKRARHRENKLTFACPVCTWPPKKLPEAPVEGNLYAEVARLLLQAEHNINEMFERTSARTVFHVAHVAEKFVGGLVRVVYRVHAPDGAFVREFDEERDIPLALPYKGGHFTVGAEHIHFGFRRFEPRDDARADVDVEFELEPEPEPEPEPQRRRFEAQIDRLRLHSKLHPDALAEVARTGELPLNPFINNDELDELGWPLPRKFAR